MYAKLIMCKTLIYLKIINNTKSCQYNCFLHYTHTHCWS